MERRAIEINTCKDWVCHPVWSHDGQHIIYHGRFDDGACFLGRVNLDGSEIIEIPFPDSYTSYGHFNINSKGIVVSDGYYHAPGEPTEDRGQWISLMHIDWANRSIEWEPVCRHNAIWDCQDAHPHPIFSHREDSVYYTGSTDESGSEKRAVWRVDL